uniref:Uncharacterized protein n=1 Tax=Romanomermis culicivorax TaxID=13658 RepID=A0A915JV26_ROMCU
MLWPFLYGGSKVVGEGHGRLRGILYSCGRVGNGFGMALVLGGEGGDMLHQSEPFSATISMSLVLAMGLIAIILQFIFVSVEQ